MKERGRPKGTQKSGGRKAGTPNRVSGDIKTFLAKIVSDNREQIEHDLRAVNPRERLQIIEKFIQYLVPKQQSVQAEIDINKLTENQIDEIIDNINSN